VIELEEYQREAKFQGISVDEVLKQHDHAHQDQPPVEPDAEPASNPKFTRIRPPENQDPRVKYSDAVQGKKSQPEWGTGDQGYKPPKSPGEKMRKNVPYKVSLSTRSAKCEELDMHTCLEYKFRRSWSDF
jgi:hypothetical protein